MGGPYNDFTWRNVATNDVVSNRSELILVNLTASNGGEYRCIVENSAGRDNATVTVNGRYQIFYLDVTC